MDIPRQDFDDMLSKLLSGDRARFENESNVFKLRQIEGVLKFKFNGGEPGYKFNSTSYMEIVGPRINPHNLS